MTAFEIDTAAAGDAARAWVRWGDELDRARLRLVRDLSTLQLGDAASPVDHSIAGAATDLWILGVFVELVIERAELADVFGVSPASDAASLARLMHLAGRRVTPAVGAGAFGVEPAFAGPDGELGGTFRSEVRSPYLLAGAMPVDRGRELVLRALDDTASTSQIRNDEFEIVRMSDGRYLVVLPGVTDLSRPDLGLSDTHRSVRDLDQFAYPSSRSGSITHNRYAQMVGEALAVHGVPSGSELVLVGHSYGADTALDLAADEQFNGAAGYRVTHVVAAAYHAGPQLVDVPGSTEVLVLQNHRDLAVIAESIGATHVTEAIEARRSLLGDLLDVDLPGIVLSSGRAAYHDIGAAVAAVDHTIGHAGDLLDIATGATTDDARRMIDGAAAFLTLDPGVTVPRAGQVVAVFEGGGDGAGHHQRNYSSYVANTHDPDVLAFLASLGSSPASTGTAWAIDVSVPR